MILMAIEMKLGDQSMADARAWSMHEVDKRLSYFVPGFVQYIFSLLVLCCPFLGRHSTNSS